SPRSFVASSCQSYFFKSLITPSLIFFFVFSCSRTHRDLHSFPTRRSSDLLLQKVRDVLLGISQLLPPPLDATPKLPGVVPHSLSLRRCCLQQFYPSRVSIRHHLCQNSTPTS